MREAGLAGVSRRRGVRTTHADRSRRAAPDRVERRFRADAPDRIWVADITYVPTWTGFVYLAVVLDVFSRKVVGWAMAHHLRTELVLAALNMALGQRRPQGVVHHSDRGRLSGGEPHPKPSTNCYSYTSEDVLRRPLETGLTAAV